MNRVDGLVVALPAARQQAFVEPALESDALRRQCAALHVLASWGDVPVGGPTHFRRARQAPAGETVVFRGAAWPDKAPRDAGCAHMAQTMSTGPRFKDRPMSFDGQRPLFGGFTPVLETRTPTSPGRAA